ncbi:tol-pal system protein YbgF [Roseivivax sp. THAF40]|uniref:tol-pal system protein YbgF n=1 Tax=unclassified Roseivivax TaxID=2639302 RepID=UPI001268FD07|nr:MULTISPECIES: tol-pal system protein YbgF [unclassified Roseivivax]QFS81617.1 tol-pal system protein YbgF [Roseivivax sp. THAF197b]QFT45346.1 tol-pal system protein YbgF [Roseivivax sp. THAF40]
MLRAALLALSLAATPLAAQNADTLADIRQDLSVLTFELQKLKRELSTTSGSGVQVGGGTLDRVNAIEAELQRLTAQTEQMQFRIDQIVQDGSNRIGDLNFRICELEEGCDIGALGDTPPLGGTPPAPVATPAPAPQPATPPADATGAAGSGDSGLPIAGGAQLAAAEEADFRAAQSALSDGEYQSAADRFTAFRQTYPGSPLDAAALLGRGTALEELGNTREAARAYLEAWNTYPDAPTAPESLFRLGRGLGKIGSTQEACVTLAEVATRYPGSDAVARAQTERTALNCQ